MRSYAQSQLFQLNREIFQKSNFEEDNLIRVILMKPTLVQQTQLLSTNCEFNEHKAHFQVDSLSSITTFRFALHQWRISKEED
jgi:hypothetical protein